MKKSLLLSAILIFGLLACKKAADDPTVNETLTSTRWGIYSLTLESPIGSSPVDITGTTFKPCELDDAIVFNTGGSFSCKDSNTVCIPANNSIFYNLNGGSWTLSGDTLLTIKKGFNEQPYRIKSFTPSYVEIFQQQKNYLDQLVRYTFKLKAVN